MGKKAKDKEDLEYQYRVIYLNNKYITFSKCFILEGRLFLYQKQDWEKLYLGALVLLELRKALYYDRSILSPFGGKMVVNQLFNKYDYNR
jgi:hypothetical protein